MMSQTSVAITVIICATLVVLASIAAVVYLARMGHDTAVIGTLVGGPLVTALGVLASRMKAVHEAVKQSADTRPQ